MILHPVNGDIRMVNYLNDDGEDTLYIPDQTSSGSLGVEDQVSTEELYIPPANESAGQLADAENKTAVCADNSCNSCDSSGGSILCSAFAKGLMKSATDFFKSTTAPKSSNAASAKNTSGSKGTTNKNGGTSSNGGTSNTPAKDNTMLIVGVVGGGILLLTTVILVVSLKKK